MWALRLPEIVVLVEALPETSSKKASAFAKGALATNAAATVKDAKIVFFIFLSITLLDFTLFTTGCNSQRFPL